MRRPSVAAMLGVMKALIDSLLMSGMAMVSVGLWTLRVALTARGRKLGGSITAGAEALVFLLAFSTVLGDMEAIEKIIGYAAGVAAGTLLGVYIDDRLSAGQSEVRVITEGPDMSLVKQLQSLGWPVTAMEGSGPEGNVTIAFIAVDDLKLPGLLKELEVLAPEAFWTVERLKKARAGRHHEGWIQVHGRPTLLKRGA
jgi:uncharacterized protein YebE (UPF0316 family)